MQPDIRFKFHALVTGQGKTKFLVVTRQPVAFDVLPGVRVLVDPALRPGLEQFLRATEGKTLAQEWGVSVSLVHRLRAGLGLAQEYSGDSRTTTWRRNGKAPAVVRPVAIAAPAVERPVVPLAVAVVGDGQRQVVVIVGRRLAWDMPDAGNILIEQDIETKEQFGLWLENSTVNQAAEKLGVARNVILSARSWLGIREWGTGARRRRQR